MRFMRVIKLFLFYLKNCVFINFDAFSLKNTNVPGKTSPGKFFRVFYLTFVFGYQNLYYLIKKAKNKGKKLGA